MIGIDTIVQGPSFWRKSVGIERPTNIHQKLNRAITATDLSTIGIFDWITVCQADEEKHSLYIEHVSEYYPETHVALFSQGLWNVLLLQHA